MFTIMVDREFSGDSVCHS